MQPQISDWTFSKKEGYLNIELKDDFRILRNEAGGFRDYYETFTLKLPDNDFSLISQTIKTSKNYKEHFTDYTELPPPAYKTSDTVDF